MSSEAWVEINIRLKDADRMNEVILGFVDSFVQTNRNHVKLWHFLREMSPITHESEIRLRFFGERDNIKRIQECLEGKLTDLERSNSVLYSSHLVGNHGKYDPMGYQGEEADFGKKGWPIFADFLMKTSEVAIRFLREEPFGSSEKPWVHYLERFSHCFWNQLGAHVHITF